MLDDANSLLLSHQIDVSDPHEAADYLLKIASLYGEEPETKTAVLETIGEYHATVALSLIHVWMWC